MTTRTQQMAAFLERALGECVQHPLAGDASFRRYIRIRQGARSWMLMDAPPDKEPVAPFVAVDALLVAHGFSAPNIIAADEPQGFLLLEDLGDDTFSRLLRVDVAAEEAYYHAAISLLAAWHTGPLGPASRAFPAYDTMMLAREVRLFSDWFLPQLLDGTALADAQASYLALWQSLFAQAPLRCDQFVHRDYHADNLMWLPQRVGHARVGLLDFQDAVCGDAAYDLVSLLEDARRDVAPDLALRLRAHYLEESGADRPRFDAAYALLAAQRNSKIVGIFTRLAARDGKAHYLDFLPRVWAHLARDVSHPLLAPLAQWLEAHVPSSARGAIVIRKNAAALGLAA